MKTDTYFIAWPLWMILMEQANTVGFAVTCFVLSSACGLYWVYKIFNQQCK